MSVEIDLKVTRCRWKGKYIAVRPNALIEARYNLTSRQNDIIKT
ncbi:hypothetical protein [Clostridium sp. ZBS12]|nr:hypothetical protein [Clostridium sp. ZBS12]